MNRNARSWATLQPKNTKQTVSDTIQAVLIVLTLLIAGGLVDGLAK